MRILSLSTHPHAWEFMGGFWVYLSIRMRVSDDWIFLNMHTCVNIISNRQVVEHSSTVRYKSEELIFFFFSCRFLLLLHDFFRIAHLSDSFCSNYFAN